jgi:hypothetical protein
MPCALRRPHDGRRRRRRRAARFEKRNESPAPKGRAALRGGRWLQIAGTKSRRDSSPAPLTPERTPAPARPLAISQTVAPTTSLKLRSTP